MKKKQTLALVGFFVLLLAALLLWLVLRPSPTDGMKTIMLEIVHGDGSRKTVSITTGAENLRGALEQVDGLIGGEEGPYGIMVDTVDAETADWSRDQSWWCLTKDGEWMDTGVDDTVIADGEHYEFTYTVG